MLPILGQEALRLRENCANESRPGVVSELLTPEEAAHKVLVIAGKIPQRTALGIAGPVNLFQSSFRKLLLLAWGLSRLHKRSPRRRIRLSLRRQALFVSPQTSRLWAIYK